MKILRTKLFSAAGRAKLAERAAKRASKEAWEIANGEIGGWANANKNRRKQIARAVTWGNTAGAKHVRILGDTGKNVELVDTIEYMKPLNLNHKINSKALFRAKGNEGVFNTINTGEGILESDYTIKKRGYANNKIKERYESIRKGTTK